MSWLAVFGAFLAAGAALWQLRLQRIQSAEDTRLRAHEQANHVDRSDAICQCSPESSVNRTVEATRGYRLCRLCGKGPTGWSRGGLVGTGGQVPGSHVNGGPSLSFGGVPFSLSNMPSACRALLFQSPVKLIPA
jgi:hypothetical protein